MDEADVEGVGVEVGGAEVVGAGVVGAGLEGAGVGDGLSCVVDGEGDGVDGGLVVGLAEVGLTDGDADDGEG